jgi:DUF1680 family protein
MTSAYPLDGHVVLKVNKLKEINALKLRIPSWASGTKITVNGVETAANGKTASGYAVIERNWKKGDVVTIDMPMRVRLIEANPLVEESKNQVAVMRGPLVYCLEGVDIADSSDINSIAIPTDMKFTEKKMTLDGNTFIALEGDATCNIGNSWGKDELYREVSTAKKKVHIRLIPYYAWGNRGETDMTVFMNRAD